MAARSSARCITFDRKYLSGNTGNTFPHPAPIHLVFAHMFFFTNTKPGSQGIAIAIKIPSIPEVLRALLATILPWFLLNSYRFSAVFTWPSVCCVQGAACEAVPLRCQSPLPSHVAGLPGCQLSEKYAKICQMLQIRGNFSTSDPAYIQHQLFHKEPVSVISCLIARDLRAVEHFDT